MIINGRNIHNITIYDKSNNNSIIASITDEALHATDNVGVTVDLATIGIENHQLVEEGDLLYYEDTPEENYVVVDANEKTFTMRRVNYVIINGEVTEKISDRIERRLPNASLHGKLEDYGIKKLQIANE